MAFGFWPSAFPPTRHEEREEKKLIKARSEKLRCRGCGKFLSTDDTYVVVSYRDHFHMTEKCLRRFSKLIEDVVHTFYQPR